MAFPKEKMFRYDEPGGERSFPELITYLALTSRLDNIGMLFTSFGGVISTLLAGIYKSQDDPTATSPVSVLRLAGLCTLHCVLLGAAGNTWNDWMDRDIDSKVARTKDRPLASGKISATEAFVWMTCLYSTSVGILKVMLGSRDVWPFMLPLTAIILIYPLGKRPIARRLRIYPQYLLGTAVGYPTMYGWAAVYGPSMPFTEILQRCLSLWFFLFFWSFYANTSYSYQDVEDDRKMKVNSAYNLAGKRIRGMLVVLASIALFIIPFVLQPFSSAWLWLSWIGAWVPGIIQQLISFDPSKPESGGVLHLSTVKLGLWTVFACMLELYFFNTATA